MKSVVTRAVALPVLLIIGALVVAGCGDDAESGQAGQEPATLYLAGDGEMWVVDVADEEARHIPANELSPGDPPHRIAVRGDRLVLWGYDTLATSADHPDGDLERLATDSLIWIPSDNPEAVWVGFPSEPEEARGLDELQEIDAEGAVLTRGVEPPDGTWPYAALTDGLLFAPSGPVVLMDPESGRVLRSIPPGEIGDMGPVHGNLLASASYSGERVILTDFATGAQREVAAPAGFTFDVWAAEFSPDGQLLGVPVRPSEGGAGSPRQLALVSVEDREVSIVPGSEVPDGYVFVAWAAAGDQVYMTGGDRSDQRVLLAHELGSGGVERLDVDVGDFYDVAAR